MTLHNVRIPIIGFSAPSGTGKTTLLRYLVGALSEHGLRVGVVKQARNDFDIDRPGKDSYELRKAGVERLLLGSEKQSALITEHLPEQEPHLDELILLFDQDALDIILVEGFRDAPIPKIELHRADFSACKQYLPADPWVVAVASDTDSIQTDLPLFDINDPWTITEFIIARIGQAPNIENITP